jgi:hypothetical protein
LIYNPILVVDKCITLSYGLRSWGLSINRPGLGYGAVRRCGQDIQAAVLGVKPVISLIPGEGDKDTSYTFLRVGWVGRSWYLRGKKPISTGDKSAMQPSLSLSSLPRKQGYLTCLGLCFLICKWG